MYSKRYEQLLEARLLYQLHNANCDAFIARCCTYQLKRCPICIYTAMDHNYFHEILYVQDRNISKALICDVKHTALARCLRKGKQEQITYTHRLTSNNFVQ